MAAAGCNSKLTSKSFPHTQCTVGSVLCHTTTLLCLKEFYDLCNLHEYWEEYWIIDDRCKSYYSLPKLMSFGVLTVDALIRRYRQKQQTTNLYAILSDF